MYIWYTYKLFRTVHVYNSQLDGTRMCFGERESDLFDTLWAVLFGVCVHEAFVVVAVVIILYTTDGGGVTDKSVSEYYTGHNGTNPVLKIRFII